MKGKTTRKKLFSRFLNLMLAVVMLLSTCLVTGVDVGATNYTNKTWNVIMTDGKISKIKYSYHTTDTFLSGTWVMFVWEKGDTTGQNDRPAILDEASLSSSTGNGDHEMELSFNGEFGKEYVVGFGLRDYNKSATTESLADWPYIVNIVDCVICKSDDQTVVKINGVETNLKLEEVLNQKNKVPSPTFLSRTDTTVAVNEVTVPGETVEYAISTTNSVPESNWQDDTEFTGLTANTKYYVYARVKGKTDYEVTSPLVVTTKDPEGTPYRAYDLVVTQNQGISYKFNLDATGIAQCVRCDMELRAGSSPTEYSDVFPGKGMPYQKVLKTEVSNPQATFTKENGVVTINVLPQNIDEVIGLDEEHPYVWMLIRPCYTVDALDRWPNDNLNPPESLDYYDDVVCLGKFSSLADFQQSKVSNDHTHKWTYSENGSTLTATCTCPKDTKSCEFKDVELDAAERTVTISIEAESQPYSGKAYTGASITDTDNAWLSKVGSLPTITYYQSTGKDSDAEKGSALVSAPSMPGDYIAEISVTDGSTTYTAKKAFSITSYVDYASYFEDGLTGGHNYNVESVTGAECVDSDTTNTLGVTWDEDEQCAVFDGEAYYVIENPLGKANADTGFTICFEACISSKNNNTGSFYRANGTKATKNGWQRLFDLNDGTYAYWFIINAGNGGHLQVTANYGGTGDSTDSHKSNMTQFGTYYDAWHVYTLVVAPGGNLTLYVDGKRVSYKAADSIITNVLNGLSKYDNCYIGTSSYEVTNSVYPDGFFIGKIKGMTFAEGTLLPSYNGSKETYTLQYNTNGGSSVPSVQATALPATLPTPTKKDGAAFLGWYSDSAFEHEAAAGAAITSNTILYAKWSLHDWEYAANKNVITAKCKDGENCTYPTCTHNTDETAIKLTLEAPSIQYEGSSYLGATLDKDKWEEAELAVPKIEYKYKSNEGGTYAPVTEVTKAGWYEASVTVSNVTAVVEFQVVASEWDIARIPVEIKLAEDSKPLDKEMTLKFKLNALTDGAPMPVVDTGTLVFESGSKAGDTLYNCSMWSFKCTETGTYYYEVVHDLSENPDLYPVGATVLYLSVIADMNEKKVIVTVSTPVADLTTKSAFAITKKTDSESQWTQASYNEKTQTLYIGGEDQLAVSQSAFNTAAVKSTFTIDFSKSFYMSGTMMVGNAADGSVVGFVPTPGTPALADGSYLGAYAYPTQGKGIFLEFDSHMNGTGYGVGDNNLTGAHFALMTTNAAGYPSVYNNQVTVFQGGNFGGNYNLPKGDLPYTITNDAEENKLVFTITEADGSKTYTYTIEDPTAVFGTNEVYMYLSGAMRLGGGAGDYVAGGPAPKSKIHVDIFEYSEVTTEMPYFVAKYLPYEITGTKVSDGPETITDEKYEISYKVKAKVDSAPSEAKQKTFTTTAIEIIDRNGNEIAAEDYAKLITLTGSTSTISYSQIGTFTAPTDLKITYIPGYRYYLTVKAEEDTNTKDSYTLFIDALDSTNVKCSVYNANPAAEQLENSKELIFNIGHEHKWNVTKGDDEDTLTATCICETTNEDCPNRDKQEDERKVTVKLEVPSEPVRLDDPKLENPVKLDNKDWKEAGGPAIKITYKYREPEGEVYNVIEDTDPKHLQPGYYQVIVTSGGETITSDFVVNGKSKVTTPPTGGNKPYTEPNQPLVTPGTAEHGTIKYAIGTVGGPTSEWSTDIPKADGDDTYYIWYYSDGDPLYDDTTPVCVTTTITGTPHTHTWTIEPDDTNDTLTGTCNCSPTDKNCSYKGKPDVERKITVQLVVTDSRIYANEVDTNPVTLDTTQWVAGGGPNLTVTYKYKSTEGGTYAVTQDTTPATLKPGYYQVTVSAGDKSVTSGFIVYGKAKVIVPPTGDPINYTGEPVKLVSKGTAKDGTMYYAVSTDGENPPTTGWSTEIPTGTDKGTYYVWYRSVNESPLYTDTDPVCVPVKISKIPTATKTNETIYGKNDGTITLDPNDTEEKEYSTDGGVTYKDITGTELTGLTPGTYKIRYKVPAGQEPYEPRTLIIQSGTPITLTFDANGGDPVTGIPGMKWHDTLNPLPTSEKTGYTLKEWNTKLDGTGDKLEVTTELEENTTYYAIWEANTYTVKFDANGGKGTMDSQTFVYDNTDTLKKNTFTKTGKYFAGWALKANAEIAEYLDGASVKNLLTENGGEVTFYAVWSEEPISICGTVTQETGPDTTAPVPGATVQLKRGNDVIAYTTTDKNGNYIFTGVPTGEYDIVVTGSLVATDPKIKTVLVTVTDQDTTVINVTLPQGKISSVVESDIKAIAGGLDDVAVQFAQGVASTDTLKIILTVEQAADVTDSPEAADYKAQNAIKEEAAGKTLEFLNMDIAKYINGTYDSAITNTIKILEIIIPYETSGKSITMYRFHDADNDGILDDGQQIAMTRLSSRPTASFSDNSYYVGNGYIAVYARCFSVYAIGYSLYSGGITTETTYALTAKTTGSGTAEFSKEKSASGKTITLTVNPETGYKLKALEVKDSEGNLITITKTGDNTYTFTMPAAEVTANVVFVLDSGVSRYLNTGNHILYISGYPDGSVQPTGNITRAETAMMFYRLLLNRNVETVNTFNDVDGTEWYATAVNTLASLGIVNGYEDGAFHANNPITRAEFTTIAMRFAYEVEGSSSFIDVAEDYWAEKWISAAATYGWVEGYNDGTFKPTGDITRAEAATIINHMLERSADQDFITEHKAELKQFSDLQNSSQWYYCAMVEACNAHDFEPDLADGGEIWKNLK